MTGRTSTDIISQGILIKAAPETVYDVVSRAEHIAKWFADEVAWGESGDSSELEPVAGARGIFVWRDDAGNMTSTVEATVVAADRPSLFSFTWVSPERQRSSSAGSAPVLVEFRINAEAGGTRLVVCESGLDAVDWNEQAKAAYAADHSNGWAGFLPKARAVAESFEAQGSA